MTNSRRSALKMIEYGVAMSNDFDEICSRGIDFPEEARETAEKSFTADIANLFALLKEWEDNDPSMSLSLEILQFYTYKMGQELIARSREK